MAEIDEILWQETKENLMSAAKGQEEIEWIVESQLQDMKECGFFDIEEEPEYDMYDRVCSYPCEHCGEGDEDDDE